MWKDSANRISSTKFNWLAYKSEMDWRYRPYFLGKFDEPYSILKYMEPSVTMNTQCYAV